MRRSPPRLLPPPREPRCARLRCWMARAWKLARGQRVPRVLLLCAASGMTEAEAALAGAHVTSVSVQPSRGWCGTHLQTSAEDYLVELRADYKQRLRRLERAGTLEHVALQLLSSWGLWRLRRQDICLAHPSCKIIGTCGRAQGRSKREVQRALQLPLDLLLDKSGVFEAVYVENPAGGILQQRWRALKGTHRRRSSSTGSSATQPMTVTARPSRRPSSRASPIRVCSVLLLTIRSHLVEDSY